MTPHELIAIVTSFRTRTENAGIYFDLRVAAAMLADFELPPIASISRVALAVAVNDVSCLHDSNFDFGEMTEALYTLHESLHKLNPPNDIITHEARYSITPHESKVRRYAKNTQALIEIKENILNNRLANQLDLNQTSQTRSNAEWSSELICLNSPNEVDRRLIVDRVRDGVKHELNRRDELHIADQAHADEIARINRKKEAHTECGKRTSAQSIWIP